MCRGRRARGCRSGVPRTNLRTVLRDRPSSRAMARTERPCKANSRKVFTIPLLSIFRSFRRVHLYERNAERAGQFFLAIWVKSTPALIGQARHPAPRARVHRLPDRPGHGQRPMSPGRSRFLLDSV